MVYSGCKLEQDTYGWSILKLKWEETLEKTYLETI